MQGNNGSVPVTALDVVLAQMRSSALGEAARQMVLLEMLLRMAEEQEASAEQGTK